MISCLFLLLQDVIRQVVYVHFASESEPAFVTHKSLLIHDSANGDECRDKVRQPDVEEAQRVNKLALTGQQELISAIVVNKGGDKDHQGEEADLDDESYLVEAQLFHIKLEKHAGSLGEDVGEEVGAVGIEEKNHVKRIDLPDEVVGYEDGDLDQRQNYQPHFWQLQRSVRPIILMHHPDELVSEG